MKHDLKEIYTSPTPTKLLIIMCSVRCVIKTVQITVSN